MTFSAVLYVFSDVISAAVVCADAGGSGDGSDGGRAQTTAGTTAGEHQSHDRMQISCCAFKSPDVHDVMWILKRKYASSVSVS